MINSLGIIGIIGVNFLIELIAFLGEYVIDYILDHIGQEGRMTINMALLIWATLGIVAAYFYWRQCMVLYLVRYKTFSVMHEDDQICEVFETREDAESWIAENVSLISQQAFPNYYYIEKYKPVEEGTFSCHKYRKGFMFTASPKARRVSILCHLYSTEYIQKEIFHENDGSWSGTIPYKDEITDDQCVRIVRKLINFSIAKENGEVL